MSKPIVYPTRPLTDKELVTVIKRITYVLVLMHCNHDFGCKTLDSNLDILLNLTRDLEEHALGIKHSEGHTGKRKPSKNFKRCGRGPRKTPSTQDIKE